jgi:hypothetical protein
MRKTMFPGKTCLKKCFVLLVSGIFVFSVSFKPFAMQQAQDTTFEETQDFDITPQTDGAFADNNTEEMDDFDDGLPDDIQGPHRYMIIRFLNCLCSCLPSCSKKLLLNGTYFFKMLLKTLGNGFAYGGGADLISNLLDLDKKDRIWFVSSAAAFAFLQTGSEIANRLLKADKTNHPEDYE